jgi:hypothetical protein
MPETTAIRGGARFESSSPNLFADAESLIADNTAGWLLLVATPGSDPDTGSWSNRKTPVLQTGPFQIRQGGCDSRWVHFPMCTVPWSSGDDSWLTTRKRWFESIRDPLGLRPRYANG